MKIGAWPFFFAEQRKEASAVLLGRNSPTKEPYSVREAPKNNGVQQWREMTSKTGCCKTCSGRTQSPCFHCSGAFWGFFSCFGGLLGAFFPVPEKFSCFQGHLGHFLLFGGLLGIFPCSGAFKLPKDPRTVGTGNCQQKAPRQCKMPQTVKNACKRPP